MTTPQQVGHKTVAMATLVATNALGYTFKAGSWQI